MRHWPMPLILLATALVYQNSFPGTFLYDDRAIMLEHSQVRGDFRYTSFLDHYGGRPLTLLTFHWNYRLAGENPTSYHVVSVLLHLLAVAAAFGVALELGASPLTASAAALLFGVHPLQTQGVNYIWSRSMLLMSVFGLFAILVARRRPWLALLLFQLAVWSRAEALILAVTLALIEPRLRKAAPLLGVVNGAAFLVGLALHAPLQFGWNHPEPLAFWLKQPAVFWEYVSMMLWPAGLHVDHLFSGGAPAWVGGLLAAAGLMTIWFYFRQKQPALAWGALWVVLLLTPAMAIPNTDLVNESRSYLALFGFALAAPEGIRFVFGRRKGPAAVLIALWLIALVPISRNRNAIWSDEVAVWRDAATKSPGKGRVRYNLASALARIGNAEEAEEEFRRAVELDPSDDMAHAGLGYCAELRENPTEAESHYRKALEINPLNAYAREGLLRVSGN